MRELTGYQMPSYQSKWLEENGIKHYVNAHGKVIVPATAIVGPATYSELDSAEPDFSRVA